MAPHPVLQHPVKPSGEGAAVWEGKSETAEPISSGDPCSWGGFLSLLCDLSRDIPLLNCLSVDSGCLRSPADLYPPSECAYLAVDMVSPILRKLSGPGYQ